MSKHKRIAALEQRVAELERIVAGMQVYRIELPPAPPAPIYVPWVSPTTNPVSPTLDPCDGWPPSVTVSTTTTWTPSDSGGTQNITDEEARVIEDVLSRHRDGLARLARREAPSDNT